MVNLPLTNQVPCLSPTAEWRSPLGTTEGQERTVGTSHPLLMKAGILSWSAFVWKLDTVGFLRTISQSSLGPVSVFVSTVHLLRPRKYHSVLTSSPYSPLRTWSSLIQLWFFLTPWFFIFILQSFFFYFSVLIWIYATGLQGLAEESRLLWAAHQGCWDSNVSLGLILFYLLSLLFLLSLSTSSLLNTCLFANEREKKNVDLSGGEMGKIWEKMEEEKP